MYRFREINTSRVRDYLYNNFKRATSDCIPEGATDIKIYKISKLYGGINYAYILFIAYRYKGADSKLKLILKLYKDAAVSQKKCREEYQILEALERVNLCVPHVHIIETDEKILGAPFIIMEKVEGKTLRDYVQHLNKQEIFDIIKRFAETLVFLHELNWEEMGLDFLRSPKDEYEYAKKQKNDLPSHVKRRDFEWAINWLKRKAPKCPCNRYSLLHGDMNPKNFLVAKDGRIIMLDWEWTEIGDALKDVGYAYHNLKHMFGIKDIDKKGEETASYFIKQYLRFSNKKINPLALRFYLFSAGLREAIYCRYLSKRFVRSFSTIKSFGTKSLLLFPLVSWHFRSRYKHLERFLRREAMDYEQVMFGTIGGRISSALEIEDILRLLEAKPSELILDVGTGSGRVAREIVLKTKARVIGIDAGRLAIESAKMRGRLDGYEMVIADGQYMPFKNNSFDAIICIRALKYFPDYILGVREMKRVLKPNKRLVVDLSSTLGYEIILRHITHATSVHGAHVFNFYKMKNLLEGQKIVMVDMVPLQKIPYKVWNLSKNLTILRLLVISEEILRKITPLILCRSILVKCIKS